MAVYISLPSTTGASTSDRGPSHHLSNISSSVVFGILIVVKLQIFFLLLFVIKKPNRETFLKFKQCFLLKLMTSIGRANYY
jgi:hypothetical protein